MIGESEGRPLELELEREQMNLQIRKRNRGEVFSKRRLVESPISLQLNDKFRQLSGCPLSEEYVQFNKVEFTPELFSYLTECLQGTDQAKVLYGLVGIRKLLSENAAQCIQNAIDFGAVRHIIAVLKGCTNPCFLLEAAWCVINIASGTTEQCQCLVDKGVIPVIVQLLFSSYNTVIEQAIWAVANIGGDSDVNRDELLSYGVLQQLVRIVEQTTQQFIREKSLWAIANLCRGKPAPKFNHVKEGLRALCRTLREHTFQNENDVHVHLVSAINLHCSNKFDRIQFFLEEGIVPRLVDFLAQNNDQLVLLSLRVLGNIVTGSLAQTLVVLEAGIFPYLQMLMDNDSEALRREACWILSNLAATNQTAAEQIVFNEKLVQRLLEMTEFDKCSVQKEVVWIFNHACDQCNPEDFIRVVQDSSLMRYLVHLLDSQDLGIVEAALQTIDRILQVGAIESGSMQKNPMITELNCFCGIEKLEEMQTHKSDQIFKKVSNILTKYFDLEEPQL